MRIAIDAMGGDHAPDEIIAGAKEAVGKLAEGDEIILVGPEDVIEPQLGRSEAVRKVVSVAHAADTIGMDESPIESLRKKPKSSIGLLAKLAKHGRADAVISGGNTGACVAAFLGDREQYDVPITAGGKYILRGSSVRQVNQPILCGVNLSKIA